MVASTPSPALPCLPLGLGVSTDWTITIIARHGQGARVCRIRALGLGRVSQDADIYLTSKSDTAGSWTIGCKRVNGRPTLRGPHLKLLLLPGGGGVPDRVETKCVIICGAFCWLLVTYVRGKSPPENATKHSSPRSQKVSHAPNGECV